MTRLFRLDGKCRKRPIKSGILLSECRALNAAAEAAQQTNLTLGDLGPEDHLILSFNWTVFLPLVGLRCQCSVYCYEPPGLKPRHYWFLPYHAKRFFAIFTYSQKLLKQVPNGVWFNGHLPQATPSNPEKSKRVSIITSAKTDHIGHRMRLEVAKHCADCMDLYGRAFTFIESKNSGLDAYYYSVAVENTRSAGYFTEKILDCFVTRTIPIYWGDPTIGEHFDLRGIVYCETQAELEEAIRSVNEADYSSRLEAIEHNYTQALRYDDRIARLGRALEQTISARGSGAPVPL